MLTSLSPGRLSRSVLAVPPLARGSDFSLSESDNAKIIRHVEAGGITTLLYGGNANFYHLPPDEFDGTLALLEAAAGADTLVIPSVGPAYGTMMEQAKTLRRRRFPTVMVLPQQGITTGEGVEAGVRRFVESAGVPVLLYVKHEGYLDPQGVQRLVEAGLVSGIKYAIVRPDPSRDPYLRELVGRVDPRLVVSGIGEQPAVVHLNEFGLGGFTSGCVCVAPGLSAAMLAALRAGDTARAERVRLTFAPLEDLRNEISPIRVLHEAVRLAGIADTGPLLPLLSNLPAAEHARVKSAAVELLEADRRSA